jgi:outer membrane protein assembly factor BamE
MHKSLLRGAAGATLILTLAGCSSSGWTVPRIPGVTPYRMEVQQGNSVTQDMVSQLKRGMSKEEVRAVLGTPLLADIFHAERWDYVYWREQSDGKREQRKLAVFFSDGKLARVAGDVMPAKESDKAPEKAQEKQ